MAVYQNGNELSHLVNNRFSAIHVPGAITPHSGIYMCTSCRDEIASNAGNPLPPQNHRQHDPAKGQIRWQLLVETQNGPPNA